MIFTVYSISVDGKVIYIGHTKDMTKRTAQHKYAIKSRPNDLYAFARKNNITEFTLVSLREFKSKVEAKRYECLLILQDHFGDQLFLNKVPNISDR